ncbi:MAG TPA: cupredoxin domain-containing protein [Candidatus Nanopelagicales bacterium]|nr:cupredoxin domain-containing protein [Candidatus Nanopelagicales bacterium]
MIRRPVVAGLLITALGALPLISSKAAADGASEPTSPSPREIEIVVDGGYQPARVVVTEGERIRLKFVRRDYSPCSREVVFASLGIRRELPTGTPVLIDLPALSAGEIEFKCGMSMLRGVIVVEPRT